MTITQHLESARDTLEDMLVIVQDPHLKSNLARAYADISIALKNMRDLSFIPSK